MEFNDLIERVTELAEKALESATPTSATACGLDQRAARNLWVGDDFIAVRRVEDRSLQYYGGFEYVDSAFRSELGDYVFYSTEDSRVAEHHDRVSGVEE